MSSPQISIVIPAYNESARIEGALARVLACVYERQWDAEVLVVDDGSTDDTAAIVQRWMAAHPTLQLFENPGNRGKGYSVRNGLLQAAGEIVMFTDADLSAPIEEAQRLFDAIDAGADVAIGSRWLDKQRQTKHQPLYRRFFGRCYNALTRAVMGLPYKDTQCGFKAFRRSAARCIFPLQTIERWGFDPEILFIAQKLGFHIVEVPVTWGHDERSRISYLRDGSQMLKEMMEIRSNSLRARYDRAIAAMKDTSGFVTARVPSTYAAQKPAREVTSPAQRPPVD
ncbi:MAG: glycosyltransferase family 2 protein, partial [Rhodospirillales bacterium]|nr:glycosyltransferase family 2 protein [Acetobacter sp.]